ncbi:MAG: MerR family transcriptional regulator, partial [Bauldia sp.]|nr:MerR family transcriptional regulator [Bauldia sp.]
MASKGPEAFRTISEVAEDLDLPQHVLRFWETRFTQIRPMTRGGGRRYYRPDDVDLLRGIRHLLYGEGYTIRGVQRILREQGPRFVVAAGRGDMSGLAEPAQQEDEPRASNAVRLGADLEDDEAQDAESDAHLEPTFDPREFRPRGPAAPNGGGPRKSAGLSDDDVRRLQATLSDLLELKRLLDQAGG